MKKHLIIATLTFFITATANAQFFDKALKKMKDKAKEKFDAIGGESSQTQDNQVKTEKEQPTNSVVQNAELLEEQGGIKAYSRYDFLPGSKIIYYENFEHGVLGELPEGWNGSGKGELVTLDKYPGKWLRLFPGTKYLSGNKHSLGENYTIEFDLILQGTPPSGTRFLPDLSLGLFASERKS